MEPQHGYRQRLAEIDAAVTQVRTDPGIVLARAAGLLAGRAGCRVHEAHAHLLRLATELGRDPADVAAEALVALEEQSPDGSRRLRAAAEQVVRPRNRLAVHDRRSPRPQDMPGTGDWPRIVQQVLDAMPGKHVVLAPVRDAAGEIADYLIVAASPSAADLSGRRGAQMVGRRAGEAYPAVMDGSVFHAWRDTLADGLPREIGPFPTSAAPNRGRHRCRSRYGCSRSDRGC